MHGSSDGRGNATSGSPTQTGWSALEQLAVARRVAVGPDATSSRPSPCVVEPLVQRGPSPAPRQFAPSSGRCSRRRSDREPRRRVRRRHPSVRRADARYTSYDADTSTTACPVGTMPVEPCAVSARSQSADDVAANAASRRARRCGRARERRSVAIALSASRSRRAERGTTGGGPTPTRPRRAREAPQERHDTVARGQRAVDVERRHCARRSRTLAPESMQSLPVPGPALRHDAGSSTSMPSTTSPSTPERHRQPVVVMGLEPAPVQQVGRRDRRARRSVDVDPRPSRSSAARSPSRSLSFSRMNPTP